MNIHLKLNISFLACTEVELHDSPVRIVLNGENICPTVTLTLVQQCLYRDLSKIFSYTTTYKNFMSIE